MCFCDAQVLLETTVNYCELNSAENSFLYVTKVKIKGQREQQGPTPFLSKHDRVKQVLTRKHSVLRLLIFPQVVTMI